MSRLQLQSCANSKVSGQQQHQVPAHVNKSFMDRINVIKRAVCPSLCGLAVLAAGAPDKIAFMADEAVESIAGLRPVEYTVKHYTLYLEKVLQKTAQLNKGKAHF